MIFFTRAYRNIASLFSSDKSLSKSAVYSAIFHFTIIILLFVGIPLFSKSYDSPDIVPIQITNVSEITNVPIPEDVEEQTSKKEDLTADKMEKTSVVRDQVDVPDLPDTESVSEPETKPEAVVAKPKEVKKRKPKKSKKKPPEPDLMLSVLKTIDEIKVKKKVDKDQKEDKKEDVKKTNYQQEFDASAQLSISELDSIRQQFIPCWNIPYGARDAENLSVQIRVHVNPDGTIHDAQLLSYQRMGDPFYKVAADSALRAVKNPICNPLKLPPEKYEKWKVMTLNFDPRHMFGK